MRRSDITVGLDVGSSQVRLVVAAHEEDRWRILGTGKAPCNGLRKGVVVDIEETTNAINKAAETAERIAGVPIERAVISIGGSHVTAQPAKGVVAVSRADGEVGSEDVERVLASAQSIISPDTAANREIIHVVPRNFSLDNQSEIRDPVGMNGMRLEVDALIITGSTPFIRNLSKCINQAGIEIAGAVASPLAAAEAVLNRRQKELGVVVVDIGVGTTDIAVYEEDQLIFISTLPVGAGHITNDIAIGLKTGIEVAEKVKREYGTAVAKDISLKKEINLSRISKNEEGTVKAKEIAEIIEARMEEIFSLVNKELKRVKRDGMLPAGAVLTGGGAKLPGIVDLAKKELHLPAQVGFPIRMEGVGDSMDDPSFSVVTGLVLWDQVERASSGERLISNITDKIPDFMKSVHKMKDWFKTFLP
ncbi:MAG: cell division protein FtsA [Candidatus Moraniibacteriota bacterium]